MPGRALEDGVEEVLEHTSAAVVQGTVHQGVQHAADTPVGLVEGRGVVGPGLVPNLLHMGAEDILRPLAGLLHDLHIGPVQGAQGHGPVGHQLHVAGAAGLGARG